MDAYILFNSILDAATTENLGF